MVIPVDEFRTSSRRSAIEDHGVHSKFRRCKNPRPYRQGVILRHGLVKCDVAQGCGTETSTSTTILVDWLDQNIFSELTIRLN